MEINGLGNVAVSQRAGMMVWPLLASGGTFPSPLGRAGESVVPGERVQPTPSASAW